MTIKNEKVQFLKFNVHLLVTYTDKHNLRCCNIRNNTRERTIFISGICFLKMNKKNHLLSIQLNGDLYLWDLTVYAMKIKTNIMHLIEDSNEYITKAFIKDDESLLIHTSLYKTFQYDYNMQAFTRIEASDLLNVTEIKVPNMLDLIRMEIGLREAKRYQLPKYWILFRKYVLSIIAAKNYDKFGCLCQELTKIKQKKIHEFDLMDFSVNSKFMSKTPDDVGNVMRQLIDDCQDLKFFEIIDQYKLGGK